MSSKPARRVIMQEERPYELGTSHSDRHRRTRNREGDPRWL